MAGCPVLQFTKKKSFRISLGLALLLALYALAGFLWVPRILRSELMEQIPKSLGVKPAVGEIHFNPFSFQLEVRDFSLSAPDGQKLLGFGRLFVDFELSSLWHRAYSFANIDIDSPSVNAVVARDGNLNLLQLSPKTPAPKTPEKKEPLPALRIGSFKVSRGSVSYEDHSRPSEFAARLEPLNFELVNFTTGVDGGRFTFTGSSKLGERVEWHGHLSVQPIESDGEFQIVGLRAHTIWDYLEDRLSFLINSGTIDLNATYKFSLKDAVDLQATVSKIAVSDLAVRPKQSDIDWITVPSLLVNGTTVDLLKRQAHVDSVSLTGVKLVTWLEPDGSLNLMKLAQSPAAAGSGANGIAQPAAGATASGTVPLVPGSAAGATGTAASGTGAAGAAASTAPWTFDLREFTLNEANVSAEDRGTKPAAKVLLAPLSVKVTGVSLDLSKPVNVTVDTHINETGSLNVSGDVTPQPLSANLALKLADIELKAVQPYIAQHTSMTLLAGRLSGDAKVRYGAKKPALQFAGNISVAGLHTVDNALHDDFINWDRLEVNGVNYQHDPDRLDIEQVTARKLYARVIIEPDTSLNVKRVLAGPGATVIAPAPPGGTPVVATAAAPAPAPVRTKKASGRSVSTKAAAGAPGAAPASAAAGASMPMAIKKIVLQASEADFADLSVTPNFSTGIQKLQGTILGLSSKAKSRAKVDIHGSVDAFSPVAITGEVNVLGPTLYTDLALSFRNMELSTFNPYSGKFAGYNITKGKLTTELHYKVDGRKLDAQHHIVVDQLEFGAKTASKDAVSLPIKLAVALLKDRNGVIDLNLPITGTLDDPKFRLGPIIWKVLVNILEKAVMAPFALLGSLFGGGPDMQFIDFRPGAADLEPAAADKAKAMVKALSERPQLKIEVPIATVGELDRPALVESRFLAEVRDAQAAGKGNRQKPAAAPDFAQLDPAAQVELLTQVYKKQLGGEPKFPESISKIKAKPDAEAAKLDFLEQALHEHIAIADSDLTALGQQRAMAVQQALLTDTQVDPARVFLVANDKAKNQDGKVRLELSLQ
jgi:Domain of Unknown Function (DUF748)